ncbi:DENN domain-containing protein 5B-like isoform X3 [Tubulanus polymorphus]|uniref:DENN domain-containing protein 5B-like isoform X3 n=1 Tax=Tubulanus polymorphus TaxID=672921 RepID=UPI003DA285C4
MSSSSSGATRFADYFVTVGLDVESGLEPDTLSGDNLHCPPLERPYKCKVLSHFPENVPWNPFDKDAVGMLCLPKGVSFRTQKDKRIAKFHPFIITREDGSRTYGASYIFCEEVTNRQICMAMQTLHAMHMAELSNDQSQTLYSHLGPVYNRSPMRARREMSVDKMYDINKDTLYVTKCICVITQLPFVNACREFLSQLHSAITRRDPPTLPLESYVFNVLYEVPLPPPGRSMRFSGYDRPIFCQRPGLTELPLFDFSLRELFMLLGIENILMIFTSMLLEHQILLYSSDYYQLMLVAEGICCLMFPFQWQHVYVPILPASLIHFLDAPVPFVMGLQHNGKDRSKLQLPSEANMCFVDIGSKYVEVPEDLPMLPNMQELRTEIKEIFVRYTVPLGDDINLNGNEPETRYRRSSSISSATGRYSRTYSPSSSLDRVSRRRPSAPTRQEILQQSEAYARVAAIARKTGVYTSFREMDADVANNVGSRDVDNLQHAANSHHSHSLKREKNRNNNNMERNYLAEMKFNNALREIFLNHFVYLLSSYENFVIQPPSQDMESWLSNRESVLNFDKAAFLSDQPDAYLPFLCPFLETQMFVTFIDNKVMSQWEEPETALRLFTIRCKAIKDRYGDLRAPTYSRCTTVKDSEMLLERRAAVIDHLAIEPHVLDDKPRPAYQRNIFPLLNYQVLKKEPTNSRTKRRDSASWRRKDRMYQHTQHLQLNSDQREFELAGKHLRLWLKYIQEARNKTVRQPKLSDMAPSAMSQTNWKFVETLLKECKAKTKRMVVEKMGQEAVELGHEEVTVTGVEENTLIASLCDLLERIWSHGLQTKQGKSALWSHMLSYQTVDECKDTSKPIDPNFLTPDAEPWERNLLTLIRSQTTRRRRASVGGDISAMALEVDFPQQDRVKHLKHHRRTHSRSPEPPMLQPLSKGLLVDMKHVQKMTEVKTDVGYARAFIRLALEKKQLSKHLKELLSDHELLRTLYKRYAFLRCEDEREQFLYHLLALNAVDYYAFTNTFIKTVSMFRVIIYPGKKFSVSTTTANCWISLSGQLGQTCNIHIPKGVLEFTFDHKNIGVLTTLRIGHDNTGMSPRWMIEYILVRNELTGHTYRFPCGRWLGKSVDDGSIERLLVAEQLPNVDYEESATWTGSLRTPRSPKRRSPSTSRRGSEQAVAALAQQLVEYLSGGGNNNETGPTSFISPSSRKASVQGLTVPQIQEVLGDAVNSIVKHFYKPEKERSSLTILLCGENGLVPSLEKMFNYGFRSSRLFRHKFYIWDYFEKLVQYYENILADELMSKEIDASHREAYATFIRVVTKINEQAESDGKDGKYQILVCIAIRDHILSHWLLAMTDTPVTQTMYEETAFMRDKKLLTFVVHILDSLKEFEIVLETSLIKGINL